MAITNKMRTIDSRNVVAKLEGSDPQLKDEYVVYTAHWDHLGDRRRRSTATPSTTARSTTRPASPAMLEIARAFKQVQPQPKRSILFLMVTAEEQGLLGSQYYARQSALSARRRPLANINIDGINQWGRTKDITVDRTGRLRSRRLPARGGAASRAGRSRPDPEPEKGFYYRSDHFNFAKQGVPALYRTPASSTSASRRSGARTKRDEYSKGLSQAVRRGQAGLGSSGAVEDAQLLMAVGYRVANADKMPEWKPGNEFKAKRDAKLKK